MSLIHWWVDASFAAHPDFKSHMGGTMSLRKGSIVDFYKKQKVNNDSLTTTELGGVSNVVHHMEWTNLFIQAQGYKCTTHLHQDNKVA